MTKHGFKLSIAMMAALTSQYASMMRCGEKQWGPNSSIQDAAVLVSKDERTASAGCKGNVESLENEALQILAGK